jgi:hypothetical protein
MVTLVYRIPLETSNRPVCSRFHQPDLVDVDPNNCCAVARNSIVLVRPIPLAAPVTTTSDSAISRNLELEKRHCVVA